MAEALLRLPEVLRRVGLKKSALYALIATEDFPAPKKIGTASRWREAEVDAWILALPSSNGDRNGDWSAVA